MIKLTPDSLMEVFKTKNYTFFDDGKDFNLNIGAIRMFDNEDKFTDIRFVLYRQFGQWTIKTFPSTTKPGLIALKEPMNPEGCATLKEGQYLDNWVIGQHKGSPLASHKALVQINDKPLPGYRDKERDGVIRYDNEHLFEDLLGIDLHGTYGTWTGYTAMYLYPNVGTFSEGCQVIDGEFNQMVFMNLCEKSKLQYGDKFSYTLFSEKDFPGDGN